MPVNHFAIDLFFTDISIVNCRQLQSLTLGPEH